MANKEVKSPGMKGRCLPLTLLSLQYNQTSKAVKGERGKVELTYSNTTP